MRNLGVRANGKPSSKAVMETWAEDFVKTFGSDGRLHWGQVQGRFGPEELARAYRAEDLDRFAAAFRTLNPFGRFDTAFARRGGWRGETDSELTQSVGASDDRAVRGFEPVGFLIRLPDGNSLPAVQAGVVVVRALSVHTRELAGAVLDRERIEHAEEGVTTIVLAGARISEVGG